MNDVKRLFGEKAVCADDEKLVRYESSKFRCRDKMQSGADSYLEDSASRPEKNTDMKQQ